MKKLLLLIVCFGVLAVRAQQYDCIQPGTRQYFTNSKHYLRGMRIDSSVSGPGYVKHYPFHSPRMIGNKVDANGGSWLGKSITRLSDGTTLFETRGDTAVILTQAGLGQLWTFYDDTSAVYYLAQVTQVDTLNILGSLDSVKTIQISAMKNGSGTASPLNNYRILLSKSHGFAGIFDLFNFPYTYKGVTTQGVDYFLSQNNYLDSNRYTFRPVQFSNPSYADIYDFAPGDVYQYTGLKYPPITTWPEVRFTYQDSIKTRTITGSGIDYQIRTKSYERTQVGMPPTVTEYYGSGSKFLSVPNTVLYIVDSFYMPEESAKRFIYYYDPGDTTGCHLGAYYKRQAYKFPIPLEGPPDEVEAYKAGFGQTDTTNGFMWGWNNDNIAYYYHKQSARLKNGVRCGNLLALDVADAEIAEGGLVIYPTPAKEVLHVQWPVQLHEGDLYLTDLSGKQVYAWHGQADKVDIPLTGLTSGIYFIRVVSKAGQLHRMVVIQH